MAALAPLSSPPAWLFEATDGEVVAGAINDHLARSGEESLRVEDCQVEDLRLAGRRWEGRYAVTLGGPTGRLQVPLTGVLSADGSASAPDRTAVSIEDPRWAVTLTGLPLALSHAGADRKLPALQLLTDPGGARTWLQRTLSAAFPGIRIAGCRPVMARYRPGQRGIVVCHLDYTSAVDPSWPAVVVTKAYRHGRGAHEHRALLAVAEARLAGPGGLRFAEPLAYVADEDVSVQSHLPQDRSLVELVQRAVTGGAATDEAATAVASVAGALVVLHRSELRYGGAQRIEDEIATVRAAAQKLGSLSPALPAAVEPMLSLLQQRAQDLPAGRPTQVHGAFRPAQVRLAGDSVGVLDLDGMGVCEPAQDVGRFLAKLRLVSLTAGDVVAVDPTGDLLAAAFLDRYTAEASVIETRVALWETLDLMKTLLLSWSRGRPRQSGPALALLARSAAALR